MPPPTAPYRPGSFTKNFGWEAHGHKGLARLKDAVAKGFDDKLHATDRNAWRLACGLDQDRFLVAVNFFLFNVVVGGRNVIPVDEFVRFAVMEPHSAAFDRIALFVLNLSLGGQRVGAATGVEFPTLWANEFVRGQLWQSGRWQRSALDEDSMKAFMASRIKAQADSKHKCFTNYRRVYELAKYLAPTPGHINPDAESWITPALFTAWDRRALSEGKAAAMPPSAVVAASETAEDYKLLGLDLDEFRTMAEPIAELYAEAGGVMRFSLAASLGRVSAPAPASSGRTVVTVPPSTSSSTTSPAGSVPPTLTSASAPAASPTGPSGSAPKVDLIWLTSATEDAAVAREISQRLAQKRDQVLAKQLKALYGHCCMACGVALPIGLDPDRLYAEAAHIKPLGNPHAGPDKPQNMLVLCPNHHLQFDRGILSLEPTSSGVRFVSHVKGDLAHGKPVPLNASHVLDDDCVKWHATTYANVGK